MVFLLHTHVHLTCLHGLNATNEVVMCLLLSGAFAFITHTKTEPRTDEKSNGNPKKIETSSSVTRARTGCKEVVFHAYAVLPGRRPHYGRR